MTVPSPVLDDATRAELQPPCDIRACDEDAEWVLTVVCPCGTSDYLLCGGCKTRADRLARSDLRIPCASGGARRIVAAVPL